MCGIGIGFILEELFRSAFTEPCSNFPFNSTENFFKVQWMDFNFFFALVFSLSHIPMIKSSYLVDQLFSIFFFQFF